MLSVQSDLFGQHLDYFRHPSSPFDLTSTSKKNYALNCYK